MGGILRRHWPEYLIEAGALGTFMVLAGFCAVALEHPASPLHRAVSDPLLRRALMGAAMGLTAAGIIYSPWGRQSGAHMNPAVTLTFLRLGKVAPADAAGYVAAQCLGGMAGTVLVAVALGGSFTLPPIRAIATVPGPAGHAVAFAAEAGLGFVMMLMVLLTTNRPGWARWTGIPAGALVAAFITIEAPLSGMSINPARSLASAVVSELWTGFWIYVSAPPLGMLLAVEAYGLLVRDPAVRCAKLNHRTDRRCIFRCGYDGGDDHVHP